MNTSNMSVVSPDGMPCVYISGQQDSAGIITQCNLAFCKMFGYSKRDLVGKNINVLMPEMYAIHHQDIMYREIQILMHSETSNISSKEKFLFGKSKSNYIFPFFLKIVSTPTLLNNSNYIGLLQLEKTTMNSDTVFFLLDKKKNISSMSSSAIAVFGLYEYMVRHAHLSMPKMCPELFGRAIRKDDSSSKDILIKCFLPDLGGLETPAQKDISPFIISIQSTPENSGKGSPLLIKKEDIADEQNIQVQSRYILTRAVLESVDLSEIGTVGYYVKLEVNSTPVDNRIVKEIAFPKFQFRYEERLHLFVREDHSHQHALERQATYSNNSQKMPSFSSQNSGEPHKSEPLQSKLSSIIDTGSNFFNALLPKIKLLVKYYEKNHQDEIQEFSKKFFDVINYKCLNYNKGITTYRMIDGVLQEISEDPNASFTLTQDISNDIAPDDYADGTKPESLRKKAFLIANNIKSRKSLETILSEGRQLETPAMMYLSYFLLLCLIGLSLIDYLYLTQFFNYFKKHLTLVDFNYQRLIHEQRILYNVRELTVLKYGYFTKYQDYYGKSLTEYFNYRKAILVEEIQSLNDMHRQVLEETLEMADFKKYSAYNTESNLNIKQQINSSYSITESQSLPEAVLQLISSVFSVINLEYDNISESDHDLAYIINNGMGEILLGLVNSALEYMSIFVELVSNKNPLFVGVFAGALCLISIVLIVNFFLINSLENTKKNLFSLFLEIPPQYIKILHTICEEFVLSLHYYNSLHYIEDDSEIESKNDSEDSIISHYYTLRRKRRFKNKPKIIKPILICFVIGMIVCSSFFVVDYALYENYREKALKMIPVFNRTMRIAGTVYCVLNSEREYFNESSSQVAGESSFIFMKKYINHSYERVNYLENLYFSLHYILDNSVYIDSKSNAECPLP